MDQEKKGVFIIMLLEPLKTVKTICGNIILIIYDIKEDFVLCNKSLYRQYIRRSLRVDFICIGVGKNKPPISTKAQFSNRRLQYIFFY